MNKQALTEALAPRLIDPSLLPIYEAARLVERLLPGECGCSCHNGGSIQYQNLCVECGSSGRVWDEGIVEAVADAIVAEYRKGRGDSRVKEMARAVLSALVELLTEKEHAPKDFHDTQGRAWGGNL